MGEQARSHSHTSSIKVFSTLRSMGCTTSEEYTPEALAKLAQEDGPEHYSGAAAPLVYAAVNANFNEAGDKLPKAPCVKVLLDSGSYDVNEVCKKISDPTSMNTALTAAAGSVDPDNLEIVKLLLAKKAEVDKRIEDGHSPLQFAAKAGALEMVQLLVEAKADVNGEEAEDGKQGFTPLYEAAAASKWGGDSVTKAVPIVKFLVERGANVDDPML